MKFRYDICNEADTDIYHRQCVAIEKNIPGLLKHTQLEDVDGSLLQQYSSPSGDVVVCCDEDIDEVNVYSDYDLSPFFVSYKER